jgi:hypothetical protein
MFRTYLWFIFTGLLVEITSAIHLVLKLHKLFVIVIIYVTLIPDV